MAGISYIGKPISLISHSDIRYRGILHGIDPAASTISLANVISMGTENRRPTESYIPPSNVPYEFIIFRASEVKDIAVDQVSEQMPPPPRDIHDDPAIMTASTPQAAQAQHHIVPIATVSGPSVVESEARTVPPAPSPPDKSQTIQKNGYRGGSVSRGVDGATTGMVNVQRAMGELRVATANDEAGSNGRRSGHSSTIKAGEISIPATEFDFARSNARFDKVVTEGSVDGSQTNPSEDGEILRAKPSDTEKAYNPKASFFDSLSFGSAQTVSNSDGRGRGGRGRGRGSVRREEERQRNVATFGEPGGGPGLMGPGAYVPGWGGARRGGGRGNRRGGSLRL